MEATASLAAEPRFRRLRLYNTSMGFLHLGQGIAILILSNNFALPVTTSFLNFIPATDTLEPVRNTIFNLQLAPLIASFLLISSVAHFTVSLPGVYGWYIRNLGRRINYVRWWEYSASASVMIVAIAMLSGIYDIASLILIFFVNAAMIWFGLLMELHNQTTTRTNWTAFILGSIVGVIPWVAIGIYFGGSISNATETVPTFVYFIVGSLFFLYAVFPVNMYLQYKKVGRWREYVFGERIYILLSLVAKSALAWQVFGGTLARSM